MNGRNHRMVIMNKLLKNIRIFLEMLSIVFCRLPFATSVPCHQVFVWCRGVISRGRTFSLSALRSVLTTPAPASGDSPCQPPGAALCLQHRSIKINI